MKLALCVVLMSGLALQAGAQVQLKDAGCTVSSRDHYDCKREEFIHLLAQSKTVRVNAERLDRYGRNELTKLVEQLGKQVVSGDQHADLVFQLEWIDRSGRIDVGPSDVSLGRFNVYDPSRGAGDSGLVWVETFDSGEQTPWPAIAASLIQHFRTHVVEK